MLTLRPKKPAIGARCQSYQVAQPYINDVLTNYTTVEVMAWSTIVLSIYSPPDWIDQRLQPILSTSQLIQEEENIHQNQKNSTPWKKDYSLKTILTKFTSPNIDKPFLLFVGGKGPGYLLITFYQYQALFYPNFLINAKFHILWQISIPGSFQSKLSNQCQILHFMANFKFYRKLHI